MADRTPIEAFVDLLRRWAGRGAPVFDADAILASHAAVSAFDLAGFGALADSLRTQSAVLAESVDGLDHLAAGDPERWAGAGAAAFADAAAGLHDELSPAAAALASQSATVSAAHQILGDVLADYAATMDLVTEPLATGLAGPAAHDELAARLDLAAAAGAVASRAVDESMAVLGEHWRSGGELVLAGDR